MSIDGRNRLPTVLGRDLAAGQEPQATVPAGAWQSARSLGDWTLVGCTVAPAFEFSGFEMAATGWNPPRLGPIVGPAWVVAHRNDVVLLDVRWYLDGRSGRAAYRAGHIPGAVFVDLEAWLAAPGTAADGRHPLPDPEVFATGMRSVGVSDDSVVVAYDDGGGMVAGRLVWMLRSQGHDAAVLDGGLQGWPGPGPLEPGDGLTPASGTFTPRPWPGERMAGIDEVAALPSGTVLVDARAGDRYRGEHEPVDPRAGHIPDAVNIPFGGNLTSPTGRFLSPERLRARFREAGITDAAAAVVYCGSGVTACHDLLAMEAAGLGEGRLYPGSWSQWSSDGDRPIA
jgi:thiosulfate/3-mercaptopyruvate sulfurtransferase